MFLKKKWLLEQNQRFLTHVDKKFLPPPELLMVFVQTCIHLYRVTIKVASLYFGCIVISIVYLRQTYYTIFYGFIRDEYVSPNFEGG